VLLSIEIQRRPADLVIRLSGALDVVSSALLDLPQPLAEVAVDRLVLDVSGLASCDVAGLRRLARLHDELTAAGLVVRLVGVTPELRRLAQQSGIPVGFLRGGEIPAQSPGPREPRVLPLSTEWTKADNKGSRR
jgi:anti-anti-sigma factor